MNIFPAIDLRDGRAVRLLRGDYSKMTVYSDSPERVAADFESQGAKYLHVVDLDGAKSGDTPNFEVIKRIISGSGLMVEVGGGIRNAETVKKYIDAGAFRVILGTAAVTNPGFAAAMAAEYGEKIAVGVDIADGYVAIHGWTEKSSETCFDFCGKLEKMGVKTVICTDISKDGAMSGTNLELYRELSQRVGMNIVASGGVTTIDDVTALRDMGVYGAILGKALYTGGIDLKVAVAACSEGAAE